MQKAQKISYFSVTSLLLILIAFVGGGLMAYLNATITANDQRQQLADRAATIATALDTSKVMQLVQVNSAADPELYDEIKIKLAQLKQNNRDIRRLYLVGIKTSNIYNLIDSEPVNSQYYLEPDTPFGGRVQLVNNVFASKQPEVEQSQAMLSALAPIINPRTGQVTAVLGLDSDIAMFNQSIWRAGTIPLLIAFVVAVIVGFYEWNRRRQQTQLAIRSQLVSIASHELRTPVTGMRWAAETLLHTAPEGPQRTMVQAMYDSIMNLQASTEDILQLSRLQRDPKLVLEDVDIYAMVNEICSTQSLTAQQKGVTISIDDSWPKKVIVKCDQTKMRRALHNIVSNAVKYTRDHTKITISYQQSAKRHIIKVADQGIGIPKDEQSRVFAGFYRASNAKASGASGTGLGLYLTQAILQQHKGTIRFESQENKGTTFTIELPL